MLAWLCGRIALVMLAPSTHDLRWPRHRDRCAAAGRPPSKTARKSVGHIHQADSSRFVVLRASAPQQTTMANTAAAVAALQAAGSDIPKLQQAIRDAAFLDDVPGEDRQALRAARTRLRKALAEAGGAGPQGGSTPDGVVPAEKSPHAKAEYDVTEFEVLARSYDALKWRMISKPGGATVRPDDFYRLYGLHMQATQGDNSSERPMWAERGGLDFEGRARWDAWAALKGMPADEAKLKFVSLFYEFLPSCLYADTRGGVSA